MNAPSITDRLVRELVDKKLDEGAGQTILHLMKSFLEKKHAEASLTESMRITFGHVLERTEGKGCEEWAEVDALFKNLIASRKKKP